VSSRIDLQLAQRRLAIVWISGSGLTFLLTVLQTMSLNPPFPPEQQWQWLLPAIMPTLSLIVTTVLLGGRGSPQRATVDRFALHLSVGVSVFYLLLVFVVPLLPPLLRLVSSERVEMLDRSRLFLGPMQGLVGAALGVFFVSKETGSQ